MSATTLKPQKPQTRKRETETATERLEVRLPRKDKLKVVRAAKSFGESMTAFVMHAVWREIERRERAQEMIQLSRRDQQIFVRALLSPPEVNAALLKAARAYSEGVRSGRVGT
ncbi:MAG TPA: DUF1778 domain-containing protein [Gemmatimonadaceae bacterium]|jgi:uncharacterized protein (DUF1778 family)|nr:DUF1778 domain-containing protein [Gemmatimonadaceae bacterium]